jgi:HD domain
LNHVYLPSTGAHEWQWLLADPARHWKYGHSAMALADTWEHADGWPEPVKHAFTADPDLAQCELLLALPEHQVPLPGGRAASQTDLFLLGRTPADELVAVAVEGKAGEPFGEETVDQWRAHGGDGRRERLAFLLDVLKLADDQRLGAIRYQLLHRTASALIEAKRFAAPHAVMLVHAFGENAGSFADFQAFGQLYGADVAENSLCRVTDVHGVALHLGWASDTPRSIEPKPKLGPRFDRAFALARELHADQLRKGTRVPYIAHLMAVASLVLDDGGDEDEAIAALLHDAVEDQGGKETLARIRRLFGNKVAAIVEACSDTDVVPKPPWRARKEAYIAHLNDPTLPDGAIRVSLADKLHNARAILFDLRAGHDVFARFTAGAQDQAWYYRALTETFARVSHSPMVAELRRAVEDVFGDAMPPRAAQ